MPRQARRLSETGIYHIIFRGVNHCHLFEEREDYEKLLGILAKVRAELMPTVYAYCLLDNHVHLLIKEKNPGDIIWIMRKFLSPYAWWFNKKYGRSGALIANRHKAECVESDEYLLTLVRYIHRNPLEAGIAGSIDAYRYSSYRNYVGENKSLINTSFVLGMFDDDVSKARRQFAEFHDVSDGKDFSRADKPRKSESEIRFRITAFLGEVSPSGVAALPRHERDSILASLRRQGFSVRQIERTTGISRGVIARCER